jgi:hypothetical protein
VQVLEQLRDVVAEIALRYNHGLGDFGAVSHALGQGGVAGIEGEKVGGGGAEQAREEHERTEFAAVWRADVVGPKLNVCRQQVSGAARVKRGRRWV